MSNGPIVRNYRSVFWVVIVLIAYVVVSFGGLALISEGRRLRYTPLVSAHGLLVVSWYAIVAFQAWLASSGALVLHRRIGRSSIMVLAGLVVISSITVIDFLAESQRLGTAIGNFIILFQLLLLFALGIVAARRRAIDWHMRFMLATVVSMLSPAHARFVELVGMPRIWTIALTLFGLIVPLLALDWLTRGKIHKATYVSLGILLSALAISVVLFLILEGF